MTKELIETIEAGVAAAYGVVSNWESGDLAGAVHGLDGWAEAASEQLAHFAERESNARAELKRAKAIRDLRNNSWSEAPVSQSEAERIVDQHFGAPDAPSPHMAAWLTTEGGEWRIVVTCYLPTGPHAVLDRVLRELAGGYTAWQAKGAWQAMPLEDITVFECSVAPELEAAVVAAFTRAGRRARQDFTYITARAEYIRLVPLGLSA